MDLSDPTELPDKRSAGPNVRGFEQVLVGAHAVFRSPSVVVFPRQEAFSDRAPGQDRDPLPATIWEDFLLDLPLEHVIPYLVRRDVRTGEGTPRLPHVSDRAAADPDATNLARIVQGLQRFHRLSERDLAPGIRPVDLVEVDLADRSEERRVGKECRSRWAPYH